MSKLSIEEMLSGEKSKYSLVMAVAKRAREISEKAESEGVILDEKPVYLAAQDFKNQRYEIYEPEYEQVSNTASNVCDSEAITEVANNSIEK